jgi:hypothetical protein
MTVFYVIQDHPAYIPCGQRWPLGPELAAPLGVWPSSQLAECAIDRRCWRLCGDVAVLPCCTVYRISSSRRRSSDSFLLDQRPPTLRVPHRTALNCNPNCNHQIRRSRHIVQDRLLRSVRWADIPQLSARDRRCPAAWQQQYWQQSRRDGFGARPSAFRPGITQVVTRDTCVSCCRRSLPLAVDRCCCCHRCCQLSPGRPVAS